MPFICQTLARFCLLIINNLERQTCFTWQSSAITIVNSNGTYQFLFLLDGIGMVNQAYASPLKINKYTAAVTNIQTISKMNPKK